jgi:hypothetical protein
VLCDLKVLLKAIGGTNGDRTRVYYHNEPSTVSAGAWKYTLT